MPGVWCEKTEGREDESAVGEKERTNTFQIHSLPRCDFQSEDLCQPSGDGE